METYYARSWAVMATVIQHEMALTLQVQGSRAAAAVRSLIKSTLTEANLAASKHAGRSERVDSTLASDHLGGGVHLAPAMPPNSPPTHRAPPRNPETGTAHEGSAPNSLVGDPTVAVKRRATMSELLAQMAQRRAAGGVSEETSESSDQSPAVGEATAQPAPGGEVEDPVYRAGSRGNRGRRGRNGVSGMSTAGEDASEASGEVVNPGRHFRMTTTLGCGCLLSYINYN